MKSKTKFVGKPLAWLLTLIYFASYVTRINYAAVVQEIITATGFAKTELAVVTVAVSITYGIGQIVNGRIGDIIKSQWLILIGVGTATAVNLVFPLFSFSPTAMCILWGINGFAQAMMWPSIVKILVANMDNDMYGYAVIRISWGSSLGTIFVYLTAPLIISLVGWQGVFIFSASIGIIVTVLWAAVMNRVDIPEHTDATLTAQDKPQAKGFRLPRAAIFPMIFIALAIIFQGMLRDGVTNWMPTYLAEVFQFGNETSILCTVSLAVFSILSFTVVGAIYKWLFKSEVACAGWVFAIATLSSLALYFFFDGGALIAILMMALVTGCMHGINLMLITHVPKQFRRYGNISTISGAVNSCTYIGSAIFTYGVALLSEGIGWRNTVGTWVLISLAGTLCCFVAVGSWRRFCNPTE